MRLSLHEFITLDGVTQSPGAKNEDDRNGFDRGGWMVPFADQAMHDIVASWFVRAEALLIGRNTFEMMHGYWSNVTDPDNPVARFLNHGRKYIVSSSLDGADWGDSVVIGGDPIANIAELKSRGTGELQLHGSTALAAALHAASLIDVYRLLQFPVTVGAGARLFTDDAPPTTLEVVHSVSTPRGVTYLELEPRAFATGDFTVNSGKRDIGERTERASRPR